jgi:hypothetical protein
MFLSQNIFPLVYFYCLFLAINPFNLNQYLFEMSIKYTSMKFKYSEL